MRTVLCGGNILDLHTGSSQVASLAMEDGHIAAIGEDVAREGDEVVDVSGRWLLPGLFNCHAHLGWDGIHDLREQSEEPGEITAYKCAMNIGRSLRAGVTTVRDLGMNTANIFARKAIDAGIAPPLRLFIVGRALTPTGGHTWWCCREADGVEDCRRAVREQVKSGAHWIKFMASRDGTQFTDAEMEAIVDEGHSAGIKVTADATYDSIIRRAVTAGVDCIEHGGSMSEETIQLLLDRGTWVVTTFSPVFLQAERGLEFGMTPAAVARRQAQMVDEARYAGLRAAAQAGVPIAFGTDAGSPVVPHHEIVAELLAMVRVGVCADNLAALRSITIMAARLLGLEGELGELRPGNEADVVVVNADPSADLEALREVDRVYVRGSLQFQDGVGLATL